MEFKQVWDNIKEISQICRGPSYIYAILMDKRICG